MDESGLEVPPVDVRKIQEQFRHWRAHKRGRLIPDRLWRAAALLCGRHSAHRVARCLRLNYVALRDRAKRAHGPGPVRPAAFVEWPPMAVAPMTPASPEYLLEVEKAGERTVRIRLRGAAVAEVAALARALRRKSR